MTNIELQTMNAICAIPRILKDISDKLDKLIEAIGNKNCGEKPRDPERKDTK